MVPTCPVQAPGLRPERGEGTGRWECQEAAPAAAGVGVGQQTGKATAQGGLGSSDCPLQGGVAVPAWGGKRAPRVPAGPAIPAPTPHCTLRHIPRSCSYHLWGLKVTILSVCLSAP